MDINNMSLNALRNLADNPNTPTDVLRDLAKNAVYTVRYRVARNPNTSESDLWKLAENSWGGVREEVAGNPNTSLDLLSKLVMDDDSNVRWRAAKNPNISSKILVTLFNYEKSFIYPNQAILQVLYYHSKLPYIAKVIIKTLYEEMF